MFPCLRSISMRGCLRGLVCLALIPLMLYKKLLALFLMLMLCKRFWFIWKGCLRCCCVSWFIVVGVQIAVISHSILLPLVYWSLQKNPSCLPILWTISLAV